jgi:DNA-binding NtrC family response regulator
MSLSPVKSFSPVKMVAVAPAALAEPLLVGSSEPIVRLRHDIRMAARSDSKVLVIGETGAGKEIVARLIHFQSARRHYTFVPVNSAGLSETLLESELFGHVRGSFTGAYRDRPGLAIQADRGTLFLDEVGDMAPRMQGVLLRFLETGEVHAVGSDRGNVHSDARVIAATNRNLLEGVAEGRFREDLYYRLNVIRLAVPPLRERGQDIVELFAHYFDQFCAANRMPTPELTADTEACLLAYRWPGNVRELRNVAERVALRQIEGVVTPHHLPRELHHGASATTTSVVEAPAAVPQGGRWHAADAAWDEMMRHRASFWLVVHPRFMSRDLTKADVREIVRRGLELTQGSYRKLAALFWMPPDDYKRFLAFLRQHDLQLPFREFRDVGVDAARDGQAFYSAGAK